MDGYLDTMHRISILDHQQRLKEADNARLAAEAASNEHHHACAGRLDETLTIGGRTVQTHVANLVAKLGVTTRVETAMATVRLRSS